MISAGFRTVPDWFAPANKGASVAVGDMTGSGTPDLVVLAVDGGAQPNRGAYRIGRDLDADGRSTTEPSSTAASTVWATTSTLTAT